MARKLLRNKKAKQHRIDVRKWREHYKGMVYRKCLTGSYTWTAPKRK